MYIIIHTYMSTPLSLRKKNRPRSTPNPPRPTPPPVGRLHTNLSARQLLRQFRKLFSAKLLAGWLQDYPQTFYQRAFTPLIVLWYCLFQRLDPNHALTHVVADARDGGADHLSPPGKPLSQQLRSEATASYSDGRQRLPWQIFAQAVVHSARQIASWAKGLRWHGWQVVLLDGSTCRLRPYGDIPQHFHPHRPGNCKKPPYWCVARVVVGFCLATGAAVGCVLGSLHDSEQALTALLLTGSWAKTLLVGDRNFGVYSVVRTAQGASAQVLVRLTHCRAAKLARSAGVSLTLGLDTPVVWRPSRHDQCPPGMRPEPVAGRLLVLRVRRPGFPPITLCLFTTLTDVQTYSAADLAQLYGQRWQVELNLRYVKAQLDLAALESHSADMARKDWLAGLLAYNLIRSVMVAAAARAQIPVPVLSFSRTRELLLLWLVRWVMRPQALQAWQRLLAQVARCRQPKRRQPPHSEPRAIRYYQIQFPKLEGSRAAARRKLKIANAKS